jgi:hypothetical protein
MHRQRPDKTAYLAVGQSRELVGVEIAEVTLRVREHVYIQKKRENKLTGSLENTGPSVTLFTMKELFFYIQREQERSR